MRNIFTKRKLFNKQNDLYQMFYFILLFYLFCSLSHFFVHFCLSVCLISFLFFFCSVASKSCNQVTEMIEAQCWLMGRALLEMKLLAIKWRFRWDEIWVKKHSFPSPANKQNSERILSIFVAWIQFFLVIILMSHLFQVFFFCKREVFSFNKRMTF